MIVSGSAATSKAGFRPWNSWGFGPGLVQMLGSIGPNDLVINCVAGATYGYSLLWFLPLAYSLNYLICEASSRYVLVTGETIVEGYGRLGRPVVLVLAFAIFVRRHLNNLYTVLLLGTAAHLLVPLAVPRSQMIWSLVSFTFAFTLMLRGGYPGVERFSRGLLALLGGSLVLVVVLARPALSAILDGLFIPSFPDDRGPYSHILVLMAVAGTTVGSINHLKYPAYVYEKGWRSVQEFRVQRVDLALSVLGQCLLACVIQVAAAATLYGQEVQLRTLEDLSRVFSGPLGEAGRVALGIGMWCSVLMSYVGSNTGYSLIVADVYERFTRHAAARPSPENRDAKRRQAYRFILTFFCVSPLYVVFTSWEPFGLGVVTSALFLVLTPLMLAGLLWLTNDRSLLGDARNGLGSRIGLGVAMAVSIYLTYSGSLELIAQLSRR
jgi:manganese transport protein